MAKLSTKYNKDKSGQKTLKGWQITLDNGKTVFLGKKAYTEPAAVDCRDALTLIERDLNGGGQWGAGRFSDHTEKRLERLREDRPKLFALLQEKGYIPGAASITLGELYRKYREAAKAKGDAPRTLITKETTFNHVFEYWGRDRDAATLTTQDARGYVNWLTTTATVKGRDRKGYSPATKAADIKVLRAVWKWARETKLLANDPFFEVKRGSFINSERLFYVDGDTSRRVLDACPSQEWRALFALYRFGGLRAAEALILRWRDVDFKAGKITVRSPKTEHVGKGARQTPLFPQLRKELEAWKREADASPDDRVISRFSEQTNPGPLLSKILRKAGIPLWPRLIQNLRASATMDITRHCRPTDESEWLGHSALVSLQHYQRSTRDAFDAALANENLFG